MSGLAGLFHQVDPYDLTGSLIESRVCRQNPTLMTVGCAMREEAPRGVGLTHVVEPAAAALGRGQGAALGSACLCGRWASLDRLSAVHHQGVADHEGGRVRAEPDDSGRDLLRLAHSPNRFLATTFARPSAVPPVNRPISGVSMYPRQIALMRRFWAA